MEGVLHRTTWLLWTEGVTPLDIRLRLSVVCGEREKESTCMRQFVQLGASSVAKERQRALAAREWHRDNAAERFRETMDSSWVGPSAGLDRCGKSRPHRDSIPRQSGP